MSIVEALRAEVVTPERSFVLLSHWHWLIPPDFLVVCVTRLGDAFLRDPHGSIWWLDVGRATLDLVASDYASWTRIIPDPDTLNDWSARVLVSNIEASGIMAQPGHCYTYLLCPILGGEYDPSNFKVVTIEEHFAIWGPIHERLKDIPEGTHVVFRIGSDPPDEGGA